MGVQRGKKSDTKEKPKGIKKMLNDGGTRHTHGEVKKCPFRRSMTWSPNRRCFKVNLGGRVKDFRKFRGGRSESWHKKENRKRGGNRKPPYIVRARKGRLLFPIRLCGGGINWKPGG